MDSPLVPFCSFFQFLILILKMDEPRTASLDRKTNETDIKVSINLDDKFDQKININTGIGFLDHVSINWCVRISHFFLLLMKLVDVACSCQA